MAHQNRTLEDALSHWKNRVRHGISDAVGRQLDRTLEMLESQMSKLSEARIVRDSRMLVVPKRSRTAEHGTDLHNHKTMTRLRIDMGIVDEIRDCFGSYENATVNAINNMYLTADARPLGADVFDMMMTALEKDSSEHTKALRNLLGSWTAAIETAHKYTELLAYATMLRCDVKKLTEELGDHLENVASREMMRYLSYKFIAKKLRT